MPTPNPLTILFGGAEKTVILLDGSKEQVFVRALPEVYLGQVLAIAENEQALIELVTYHKASDSPAPDPAADPIIPPSGFVRVPANWALNISSESHVELLEAAKHLNLLRTKAWAERQILVKKWVAPIQQAALEQIQPILEKTVELLTARFEQWFASMRKSEPPAASPASSS